jgi:hypothetical protein
VLKSRHDKPGGDEEVRHVAAGSFVLVEDTHGMGHIPRHSGEAQTVIWIALPNGLDPPPSPQ